MGTPGPLLASLIGLRPLKVGSLFLSGEEGVANEVLFSLGVLASLLRLGEPKLKAVSILMTVYIQLSYSQVKT